MNFHDIKVDNQDNGTGLRVVLFLSGCDYHCKNCHNPQTWDYRSGRLFDDNAKDYIFEYLGKDYIDGITFSGGDPLNPRNIEGSLALILLVKLQFHNTKTIWLYSGFKFNLDDFFKYLNHEELPKEIEDKYRVISECDVFVDDVFKEELLDVNYEYAGSTNQRVIDIKKTIKQKQVVLFNEAY